MRANCARSMSADGYEAFCRATARAGSTATTPNSILPRDFMASWAEGLRWVSGFEGIQRQPAMWKMDDAVRRRAWLDAVGLVSCLSKSNEQHGSGWRA